MDYHPGVFVLGGRDVVAAWIVLLGVAATALFVDPAASTHDNAVAANAPVKKRGSAPAAQNRMCLNTSAAASGRG